jgi:hypothetical protein
MRIRLIATALGAQLLLALFASHAWAKPCVAPPVTDQAIAQFKANPQTIIAPDADTRTIERSPPISSIWQKERLSASRRRSLPASRKRR